MASGNAASCTDKMCAKLSMTPPGTEFRYANAKHAREHWFVKLGLLLSCLPLLLTMLGVQTVTGGVWSPAGSELSAISTMPESSIDDSTRVPRKWMRRKRVSNPAGCALAPVEGERMLKYVRVVGERNSGVDGVVDLLSKLFPNVTVGSGFVRTKYWFQDERELDPEIDLEEVLVVVVLRNPYDWTLLMQRNPIFAPAHRIKHDWRRFVSRLWTTKTSITDKELSSTPGAKCQAKYQAGEVRPCRQSRTSFLGSETRSRYMDPVYETNPVTHLPLRNVLELRKFKMLNYANMTQWVPHISYLKLEALDTLEGVAQVQSVLSRAYNLDSCDTADGGTHAYVDPQSKLLASTRAQMTAQYRDYLTCNIFWSVESAVFGYSAAELYTSDLCSKSPYNVAFNGHTPLP
ncbi:Hypothetical Protein FCC1311_005212 [Hondaea fermentalgiana]|uniref:Uncharacterized protein n=1 Tax=Hondaea fermentalgiana TaxID=2315210 RepID=A0A2R5G773_9STRA|nr:Hypothetical Protein FCC1311_005212 [Hondaea fermentalgiana]|eukprot:GBG24303.1 Hypothetical Protein FCC1311_005212 [Hondaea fermentalgiana]